MKQRIMKKTKSKKADYKGMSGSHLVWRNVRRKGRGVFTTRALRKGEVIEISPAIPMAAKDVPAGAPPDGWVLEWNPKKRSEKYALGLGYIMLYNHSAQPNIRIDHDLRSKIFEVVALRAIEPWEELVWDYGCGEVWFDAAA